MMQTLIPQLPVAKAICRWIAEETGKPCGFGRAPRDDQGVVHVPPYFILYPLWGRRSGPPFAAPEADATWTWQLRAVGKDPGQVAWMYDKAVEVVSDREPSGAFVYAPPAIDGLAWMDRRLTDEDGGDAGRDNETATLSYDIRFETMLTRSTP